MFAPLFLSLSTFRLFLSLIWSPFSSPSFPEDSIKLQLWRPCLVSCVVPLSLLCGPVFSHSGQIGSSDGTGKYGRIQVVRRAFSGWHDSCTVSYGTTVESVKVHYRCTSAFWRRWNNGRERESNLVSPDILKIITIINEILVNRAYVFHKFSKLVVLYGILSC